MDLKKRQGDHKLRVSFSKLRGMDIFEEINSPSVVYYMTTVENVSAILADGKVNKFNDFVTYFFSTFTYPNICQGIMNSHSKKILWDGWKNKEG